MAKKFKIVVPKPASADEHGATTKLYEADEVVEAKEAWQDDIMSTFVENGWAIEVKMDSVDEQVDLGESEVKEIKRARNEDGTLKGDDPSTPDVNEAWEGGKAPAKKKPAAKKTAKKTTKK